MGDDGAMIAARRAASPQSAPLVEVTMPSAVHFEMRTSANAK